MFVEWLFVQRLSSRDGDDNAPLALHVVHKIFHKDYICVEEHLGFSYALVECDELNNHEVEMEIHKYHTRMDVHRYAKWHDFGNQIPCHKL